MIIKMIIFVISMMFWVLIGVIGVLRAKENRINWEMLIFIIFVPLIPIITKLCGLK